MILKPGDKVSFLDEKRDGIVKKILNNKMVLVEIEDGFDIPVLEHDLVKAHAFDEPETNDETQLKQSIEEVDETEARFVPRKDLVIAADSGGKIKNGLYIAFVPEHPDKVLSSGIAIYLLNHNAHDLLFVYNLQKNEQYFCKDFDKVDEESAILLNVIDVSDIEEWNNIQFQFLFFKQDALINKPPLVCEMNVKSVRFYKEENYKMCYLINEKCFLINLSEKQENQSRDKTKNEELWENAKIEKKIGVKVVGHIKDFIIAESFPAKHIIDKGVAEVDLHIKSITPNYSSLNSLEVINIQLNYFTKMIESGITHKFKKITFIHGVGNGKLKQEILNKLAEDYPDLKYDNSPVNRYGFGATDVIIGD